MVTDDQQAPPFELTAPGGAEIDDSMSSATIHRLFADPLPHEVVRLGDSGRRYITRHGWMTEAAARERIEQWKLHARAQAEGGANGNKGVLSLFDHTGNWSQPWEDAGYQVLRFDIQNDPDMGDVLAFGVDFFVDWFGDFDGMDVFAILAACPCTEFAVSGARHFAAKDADGRTAAAVELVHQTLRTVEYYRPSIWAIENPVGRIGKLAGLPPWRLSFDPCQLGHPYTKKTLVWGRFNADLPIAPVEPVEGSKMHRRYGGSGIGTKNARSETPDGFAYGFFMANNAIDQALLAIAGKYDRLDSRLLREALGAGIDSEQISALVSDAYYMDLDDAAAEAALREAIGIAA